MAERPTRAPESPVRTLGGLNERPSPANLRPGEFDILEGLYPSKIGLLSRIPGKTLLASVSGKVLQIHPTYNVNGDILIQTDAPALYAFTLDELFGRASTPSLTPTALTEEESMSQAIIVQREANGVNGGSLQGFISGTDSSSAANTFYTRRLTNLLVNESSTVTTFTASSGGAGAASTGGTFVLSPGTYRITIHAVYSASSLDYVVGLYNNTSAAFEVYSGTSEPVVATIAETSGGPNLSAYVKANITVSSTNKTFSIRHQTSVAGAAQSLSACGAKSASSGTVNAAAPKNTYCIIEILKTA